MRRYTWFLARGFLPALLLLAAPVRADRMGVRVRWQASPADGVAGYRVYARWVGEPYTEAHDVGLPEPDSAGTMSAIVKSIDATDDWAFAVTAYDANGGESVLSNEGRLYATGQLRPICAELQCNPDGSCAAAASPDGLGCFDGDPCAVGVCSAGSCAVDESASVPVDLAIGSFRVGPAGRNRKRLAARASLPLGLALGEPFADATVEVRSGSGRLLYAASVPGSRFKRKRRSNAFRYAKKRRAPAGANGLKQLVVQVGGEGSELRLRAVALDLARLQSEDDLTLVVRLGDRCARALEIGCGPMRRGRMRCG